MDELSSQPLLFPPAPSSSDFDSLDGATVDSGLISPVPRDTPVSSLPNVDGAAKEGSTGLLDKLKTKVGQITEYIGQGILAGRLDSEIDLVVESQKRPHPDSSEDTADSDHFSVPAKPAAHPPKKKPPVVVSWGKSRPVPIAEHGRDRSRSRSPLGRSFSASRCASSGKHPLPSGVGYEPRLPRGSGGSKGSEK